MFNYTKSHIHTVLLKMLSVIILLCELLKFAITILRVENKFLSNDNK